MVCFEALLHCRRMPAILFRPGFDGDPGLDSLS